MSVRRSERWRAEVFVREVGPYRLRVMWVRALGWTWSVDLLRARLGEGVKPSEKAAKLAARRCMDRETVR